jgi:hypothetical protein
MYMAPITSKQFSVLGDADHIVEAIGSPIPPPIKQWTIQASAHDGVDISPVGAVLVNDGESVLFTVTAQDGFQIAQILVDGVAIDLDA